ncbi:basement membrane-specific heparan sulfate proteoglycan core protein isoform X3 [Protopterus annectens]|uniref:basement membrane-specific heparan sulfate proteoglycan core protein isoform X3 n=1 Tax=Protopterus annectens TaxID=7888 RepID=UPI001CF9DC8A|nr:basement membrane-specific heparan sulfate proteoglycan core protein isoform X3 [Protopterus annectens]
MGQRAKPVSRLWYCLVLFFLFQSAVYSSKVLDEVSSPGDEEHFGASRWSRYTLESDDEDLIDVSGDGSGELGEGSATPTPAVASTVVSYTVVYYRALVNFTDSIIFSEQFDDVNSDEFRDLSDAVVDTFESEYLKIPGEQMVNVVLVKKIGGDVFVELDVGSEGNSDDEQIKQVLYAVVRAGSIGSYVTSLQGLTFRRLGEVPPVKQECGAEDFVCRDGTCIPLHFRCDYRPDCRDMSDEEDCEVTETTPLITTRRPVITTLRPTTADRTTPQRFPTIIPPLRPCWTDEAVCQNEQCIPRDYLCDGERDCLDGSDELSCGTSSPCEPNEMKCRNGRCALKLWRCDGDDDCGDNSDEEYCPTKGPGDTCAPEQFTCMSTQQCIPASYHCDDEPDCLDRSDEIGCTPPQVVTPPEETIMASRGETVQFNCVAIGVPVPLITWRLNWGHIPVSGRVSMTSEGGRGTLIIRDVKEADQGAYTCEAMNAKGMVFGIPDGVLVLKQNTGPCPEGHFSIDGSTDCLPCFCFGITKICRSTGRYRNQIRLRFTEEDDFKGVNVSIPDHHEAPPLTSSQMAIVPDVEEFQLVDLSRRFLNYESFWLLPSQFLGNKIDSYGGMLRFKVRYNVGREQSDPLLKPDVIIVGNGRKLIYRVQSPTRPGVINQREVLFREGNWQYESGAPVNRDDLMMTLANVESIMIRTAYDNKMVSIGLSDISMDHTTVESTSQGPARSVEECRCPNGYRGLSCERCAPGFERVANGVLLGICAGCNCNGHASSCDPVTGYCLNCQHNTEGSQCERCKPGFFGDPRSGRTDACKPCPCPYTAPDRRFSETCFLGTDGQATCDACAVGHTGRRCERCLTGYVGNPLQPGGKCESGGQIVNCDERGIAAASSSDEICKCKPNVVGASCNQCVQGTFHLSKDNPLGCMKCFCMGVTRECASSSWRREQVHLTYDEHERERYFLTNVGHTHTISHGITMSQTSELTFRDFHSVQDDVYYWVLPDSFKGDKVTSYGGELQFTVTYRSYPGSLPLYAHPVVVLQGNGISLEHFSEIKPAIDIPTTFVVPFRESAWRRADGQPSTREHLLMALADISTLLIRASYSEAMTETRLSNLHMDVATPYSTGEDQAGEVEHCECPLGYRGPSCQDCDIGYTRVTSGLYLGTCVRCECNGHASDCDEETGECQRCQHNTEGSRCERCAAGYYGDATSGTPHDCRPCPCPGTSPTTRFSSTCFLDTDSQPTCDSCPTGFTGRRCESCLQGYVGNPIQGQPCSGGCVCDPRGSVDSLCDSAGHCICKPNVEGQNCDRCKRGHFFLSPDNTAGCLPCFCMGVTQECTSSNYYRDKIVSQFSPGNFQNFALVNRQRSSQITTGFNVEMTYEGPELSYNQFGRLGQEPYYWRLPEDYQGDKVGAYGGHLRYTLSYTAGQRGSHIADADVQITGNDITLVANHRELRPRERRTFEILFKEQYWKRPDGHPATREHLMMALADLEEILIRASYSTDMTSSSISDVSMETAIPNFTNFPLALAVEQCRCPPGYRGLSCQDCAPGYTRTGGGLYLGNCELCECNGHSESCHPESGICLNCLYHTVGDFCDRCAPGYFGDATAGTPEDCQPCGCPLTNPENMFSPTCESLGAEGYRCTACQPGYTGQHCERCAPGYTGDPTIKGQKCTPVHPERPVLSVKVYPEKTTITQGSELVLRCQATGIPPYHFFWSREHGVPMPVHAFQRGEELHLSSVQPSDSGVYICTCRNLQIANVSRAEINVISQDKAITVTVEEPRKQKVQPGKTVNFICTAKSKSPAYTLVWTRENNRKLSNRAMDFNGILTIRNVQPEDAGIYVCTGSNMYAMDEGTAELTVTAPSKAQMFYQAYETLEGHRLPGPGVPPTVNINPPVLRVQQGYPAEFHCSVSGTPQPTLEWKRTYGAISPSAVIQRGVLRIPVVDHSDEAEYICEAQNSAGHAQASSTLYISAGAGVPPTVNISPPVVRVQQGQSAEFHCTVSGTPQPTLEWKRTYGAISPSAVIQGRVLRIPVVARSDEAEYVCEAQNSAGYAQARSTLYVSAGAGVPPTVNISPPVVRVQQGYPAEFHCTVSGTPQPTLEWKRTYGAISPSAVIQGGVLRIPVVDRSDEAEYVCEAQNSAGHAQARSTLYISAGAGVPPTVNISPPVVRVQQGQSAEFHCTVSGTPQPTLEWKRTYGTISPSAVIQGGVLRIPVVDRSDEAEYICEAQNSAGHAQARSALYINGANLPQVQVSPQKVEVQEGEIVKLYCRAVGSPSPVLSWKKQDGVIPSQALSYPGFLHFKSGSVDAIQRRIQELQARIERTDIGTLVIPSISAADGGIYLCVGTNAAGSSEARIEVIVIRATGTISSVTIRPSPANVREGETILLECLVTGSPQPMVIWYRERGTLSSNHQAAGSYLRIHQASAADTGEYICWANNTGGVQQASVQVSVIADVARPASPVISIEPHSVKVRLGENTSFKCLVRDGAQPVKIEWKMTQNKIMQDNVEISDNGSVISITGARNTNQGGYRCSASNPYGVTQAVVNLMVQGLPTVSVLPKGPVKVKVGDSISLECMGSGEPRPAVTWRRKDAAHKVISQSPLPVDNNAVLRIISAHLEDSGTYICVAQNSIGSSQFPVDITVEYPISAPGIPQITIEEPELILEEGSTAVLRCFAIGTPTPTITWSKLRSPLPWQHKVVNETLIIPKVGRQDSGQYICKASNTVGFTENYISLDVESPPYATVLPDDISVRVGDAISLQCLAHGTPPITYEWTKEDGSLPSRSTVRNGILQINGATAEDAGNYKCVVKNKVGRAHTTAVVKVKSAPLAVKVSPRVEVKGVGGTVQFTCSATGEPKPKIEWLKEGGDLPPNHSIRGNILRIENLQFKNQGVYICRATNKHGQVQDRATLTIQALPKVVINVRTYIQNVMVGSSVEFECLGIGDPKPTVSWSKADGQMSPDVVIQNGVLKIDQVKKSDAGYYRCTAINDVGTVKSQVILNVLTAPEIASQPETKEVLVGSTAVFTCLAKGYPVPQVSWTKLDGELPAEVVIEDFMLTIPSARPEHAGTYICTATNRQGKETVISMLKVKERVVPYFTQNPQSYLTLPTIKDAYKTFEVKITFRPDTPDGMLMYNGQKKSTGADFISFGLIGGRPEFRFDAGSGMATIRFATPIKLGEFHTAVLNRNQTKGYIIIDDHPPVYGSSQGRFQGLDLNEELYLGGYPDYSAIYKTSGLRSGFVGCIRELVIQGREIIFNDMDLRSHRVSNCPTCRDKPCKNNGVCLDSVASSYTCKCAQGFAGTNCEHSEAQHCHPEACGPDATCVTKRDGKGYSCKCLLGKHGEKCMDGVLITSPSFNGAESFISYPPLTNIHDELRIDMKFKPLSQTGLIFYSGGKKVMADDFVSVGMIDGHLEFRYNLGSGLAVLRSIRPVSLGEWHRVSAERIQKNGTLQVDGGVEVRKSSPGKSLGLNLRTPMYLGGVPDVKLLPPATNVNIGFHGCIEEIAINGKKTDISYSFSDSRRVMQCYESTLCDNAPCQNGGRCLLTGEYEFQCLCPDGFKGERCEITEDLCASGKICANGGTCRNNKCICPVGFSGQHCETGSSKKKQLADLQLKGSGGNDSPVLYGAYLYDDGYIALPGKLFPRSKRGLPEIIELEVRTTSPSGVIFWQGVETSEAALHLHDTNEPEGESGKGKDFINLGLQDGHLVFSYQLGSGEANIVSESPVNDGVWHKVIAVREYKQGSLQVDAQEAVRGESKGSNVMVDTKGSIYLGSPPNMTALTGGKYISGFTGCIRNLILLNAKLDHRPEQPIDLSVHAEAGRNARECTS